MSESASHMVKHKALNSKKMNAGRLVLLYLLDTVDLEQYDYDIGGGSS